MKIKKNETESFFTEYIFVTNEARQNRLKRAFFNH